MFVTGLWQWCVRADRLGEVRSGGIRNPGGRGRLKRPGRNVITLKLFLCLGSYFVQISRLVSPEWFNDKFNGTDNLYHGWCIIFGQILNIWREVWLCCACLILEVCVYLKFETLQDHRYLLLIIVGKIYGFLFQTLWGWFWARWWGSDSAGTQPSTAVQLLAPIPGGRV